MRYDEFGEPLEPVPGEGLVQAVVVAHHAKRVRVKVLVGREDQADALLELVPGMVATMTRFINRRTLPHVTWLGRLSAYVPGQVVTTRLA